MLRLLISLIFISFSSINSIESNEVRLKITTMALNSPNINEKLNFFLINRDKPSTVSYILTTPSIIINTLAIINFSIGNYFYRPVRKFYPSREFLIGREIDRHNKRKLIKQNLLWGCIIALVIGVIGGLIVWFITK